jgi:3-hydroxybutyryl-CoA dehydrogenase
MAEQPKNIAVIGAGTMGADIAVIFASGGLRVQLIARPGRSRDSLDARLSESLRALKREDALSLITVVGDMDQVPWSNMHLVVESIAEDLAVKRAVFAQLSRVCSRDTILSSNSSAIPITEIGAGLLGPERMLNLHFFMPAHLVPLVEVVCGEHSDPNIAQRLVDLMSAVGMRPVLVRRDVPGFLANRLQHALMREAWSLIDQGIATPDDVDTAVRYGFGFRFIAAGPMLQKDLSGLTVHLNTSRGIYPHLCNDAEPPRALQALVARGELGVSTGKGSFEWPAEKARTEQARYQRALARARALLDDD